MLRVPCDHLQRYHGPGHRRRTAPAFYNLTLNNSHRTDHQQRRDGQQHDDLHGRERLSRPAPATTLIVGSSGSVARTSRPSWAGCANYFPTGSSISREFEIGEGTELPAGVHLFRVGQHRQLPPGLHDGWRPPESRRFRLQHRSDEERQPLLDPDQGGNPGISSYNATFNYLSTDNDDTTVVADYIVQRYLSRTWNHTTPDDPDPSTTQTSVSGESGDGAFAIGRSTVAAFEREQSSFTAASCLPEMYNTCACVDFARSCLGRFTSHQKNS